MSLRPLAVYRDSGTGSRRDIALRVALRCLLALPPSCLPFPGGARLREEKAFKSKKKVFRVCNGRLSAGRVRMMSEAAELHRVASRRPCLSSRVWSATPTHGKHEAPLALLLRHA